VNDKNDTPNEPTDVQAEGPQDESAREGDPEGSPMSRRDVLKKGAYAAPAIMTIGSVPAFASNAPSCAKEAGDAAGNNCSDNDRGQGNNSGGNGGNGNGVGAQGPSSDAGQYGSSGYGSDDYSGDYGSSEYGGSDYGHGNDSND